MQDDVPKEQPQAAINLSEEREECDIDKVELIMNDEEKDKQKKKKRKLSRGETQYVEDKI